MTVPRVPDAELDAAIKRLNLGPGRPTVNALARAAAQVADPDDWMKVHVGAMRVVLDELELADLRATKFAVALLEARSTVNPWQSGMQCCDNCKFFVGLKSPEATIPADVQDILSAAGACAYGPPSLVAKPPAASSPPTSSFPPVDRTHWCGRWELFESRKLPR